MVSFYENSTCEIAQWPSANQ